MSCSRPLRWLIVGLAIAATPWVWSADEVFSGPQVGEPLGSFPVRLALGKNAGEEVDFAGQAKDAPLVLIFVHDVNRQSISMVRILSKYSLRRRSDGLHTGVVWLSDDVTEAENTLRRIQHALTPEVPTGISPEGREGPGSYGLNRNVMLTVLVGKQGKVTANFALVQPSLQVDLPKIVEAIVAVTGGKAPPLASLLDDPRMAVREKGAEPDPDPQLRSLLRPVIRKEASPEELDRAVQDLEKYLTDHPAVRNEVRRIAQTIVRSGKLPDYGTPRAQEHLRRWAELP